MDYDKIIKRQNTTNAILNVLQYSAWACLLVIVILAVCASLGYKAVWLLHATVIAFLDLPVLLLLRHLFSMVTAFRKQSVE